MNPDSIMAILSFTVLHMKTCGADSVTIHVEGLEMTQRCECGDTFAYAFSSELDLQVFSDFLDTPAYHLALQAAIRRTVH